MALRDRLRRLRNKSSPPASTVTPTTSAPAAQTEPAPEKDPPRNVSPDAHSATASTGQATPAATETPVAGTSSTDLTNVPTVTQESQTNGTGAPLANANTIEEVLTARAAASAALAAANGEKKKRRRLFRKKDDPYKDWPEDVYKPHEVPAPKYRRTPDPKHVENLHAFSFGVGGGENPFGNLVRRLSQQSGVSPGGSKWASPFASRAGSRAPSRLASAAPSADPSRTPSIAEEPEVDSIGTPGKPLQPTSWNRGVSTKNLGRGFPMKGNDVGRVAEEDGEGETGYDLLSRTQTAKDDGNGEEGPGQTKTDSKSSHDMPFTEQELAQALTRVTMQEAPGSRAIVTPPS